MIEDNGHLRTWAIDTPLIAAADLPARALPDHRLDYLTYEGPISGGRGRVRRVDSGTFERLEWGPDRVRGNLAGGQLVGEVVLYRAGLGLTRLVSVEVPPGKGGLKHLARREFGHPEGPLGAIGPAGQANLATSNLQFFQLHVLSAQVRRISHDNHGISVSSFPPDINTVMACMLDDPIQDVVSRHGENPGPDFLERQLDGVAFGHAGTGGDGDDRLNAPLLQLKREDHPVGFEKDAGIPAPPEEAGLQSA